MPARGWLIHAYGGPPEMVRGFADHGAYFSFSTWFLRPDKIARAEVFRSMPEERLLVETDAPDLAPPPEHDQYALTDAHGAVNHPGNLVAAYAGLARVRGMPVEDVAGIVEKNFERLFG